MDYKIEKEKADDFIKIINELEKLLTERIVDFHEVKGYVQARHAYVFYRKLLWEAKHLICDNLKELRN